MHEEIIATISQTPAHDQVLEVAITYDAADTARVELRDLTWANGIGWCRQKALSLDAATADALLKSLGRVQRRLSLNAPAQGDGSVIPLPVARRHSNRARPTLTPRYAAGEMKTQCCERFKRKGSACKTCPTRHRCPAPVLPMPERQ